MKIILTIAIIFVLFGFVSQAGAWQPPSDPDWWHDETCDGDKICYHRYADGSMEIWIYTWSNWFGEYFLTQIIECRWDQPMSALP